MNIQRLRNLTTRKLHTEMDHIYEDIGFLTGESGVMTHMLPNANNALEPYLREKLTDARFFDGVCDVTHTGDVEINPMDEEERKLFFVRFAAMPSPFAR